MNQSHTQYSCTSEHEIDWLSLLALFWKRRWWMVGAMLLGAVLALPFRPPAQWVSEVQIVPPLFHELQAQELLQEDLAALGITVPLGSETWFELFIQTYDAPVTQQAWLQKVDRPGTANIQLSRESSQGNHKPLIEGYRYEMLTLSSDNPALSQPLLDSYLRFVASIVSRELACRTQQATNQWLAANAGKNTNKHQIEHIKKLNFHIDKLSVQPYRLQKLPSQSINKNAHRLALVVLMGIAVGAVLGGGVVLLTEAILIHRKRTVSCTGRACAKQAE
ncbi:hypothetical protein [Pantoea agglomerans]|uniref:hypothetical protein n=1 Tax=Enterobacter agglomerans TaxID=549 RepID=UPI00129037CD|nr:hypothetical protein [Pantoea agglomerans]